MCHFVKKKRKEEEVVFLYVLTPQVWSCVSVGGLLTDYEGAHAGHQAVNVAPLNTHQSSQGP